MRQEGLFRLFPPFPSFPLSYSPPVLFLRLSRTVCPRARTSIIFVGLKRTAYDRMTVSYEYEGYEYRAVRVPYE